MVGCARRKRLLLEATQPVGILRKRSGQDFDGDFTVQSRVAGAPDFAHPARAERRENFVMAQACACGKCHFFISAAQFVTTVSGAFGSISTTALIRNRCPSSVTA